MYRLEDERRLRARRSSQGLCIYCGVPSPVGPRGGRPVCARHRQLIRDATRAQRLKRRTQACHVCARCGGPVYTAALCQHCTASLQAQARLRARVKPPEELTARERHSLTTFDSPVSEDTAAGAYVVLAEAWYTAQSQAARRTPPDCLALERIYGWADLDDEVEVLATDDVFCVLRTWEERDADA